MALEQVVHSMGSEEVLANAEAALKHLQQLTATPLQDVASSPTSVVFAAHSLKEHIATLTAGTAAARRSLLEISNFVGIDGRDTSRRKDVAQYELRAALIHSTRKMAQLKAKLSALNQINPSKRSSRSSNSNNEEEEDQEAVETLLRTRKVLTAEVEKVDATLGLIAESESALHRLNSELDGVSSTLARGEKLISSLVRVKTVDDFLLRVSLVVFFGAVTFVWVHRVIGVNLWEWTMASVFGSNSSLSSFVAFFYSCLAAVFGETPGALSLASTTTIESSRSPPGMDPHDGL